MDSRYARPLGLVVIIFVESSCSTATSSTERAFGPGLCLHRRSHVAQQERDSREQAGGSEMLAHRLAHMRTTFINLPPVMSHSGFAGGVQEEHQTG